MKISREVDYFEGNPRRVVVSVPNISRLRIRPQYATDTASRLQPGRGVRSKIDGVGLQEMMMDLMQLQLLFCAEWVMPESRWIPPR